MIAIDTTFSSIILKTQVNVKVYLPNQDDFMHQVTDFRKRYTFEPFKTAYLFHGIMDSAQQWVENTSVVRLAQDAGLALVIPSCGNNFYVNTIYKAAYSDFISQELPAFVQSLFPLSQKREDNFVWGISMGGYGAIRLAFLHPEMFSKVIAMSPTSDIEFAARFANAVGVDTEYVLGSWKKLSGSSFDLNVIASQAAQSGQEIPDILMIIADEDHMVRDNSDFKGHLDHLGIRNDYRIYPGDHSWGFWDAHVKECLDWLIA